MGLFDGLSTRIEGAAPANQPAPAMAEPRLPASWRGLVGDIPPSLVGAPRDGRPFVVKWSRFRRVLLERMVHDYKRGRRAGVDPTQGSLDQALDRADRVRVLRGGLLGDQALGLRVLIDSTATRDRAKLRPGLRIVEGPATFHFAGGLGNLTIELYEAGNRLMALTFPDASSLRSNTWRHDAHLANPRSLLECLGSMGLRPAALEPDPDDPRQLALLELDPIERVCRRALLDLKRGFPERALSEIEPHLRRNPASLSLRLARAKVWMALQRHDEVRQELEAVVRAEGTSPETLCVMAMACRDVGAAQQAIDLAWQAVRMDWLRAESHRVLAQIMASYGQFRESIDALNMAIRLQPNDMETWVNRVHVHLAAHQPDLALEQIGALIDRAEFRPRETILARPHREASSDRAMLLLQRSRALLMKGDVEGFRMAIDEAREADSTSLLPLNDLISFHSAREELDQALAVCDEMIDLCPDGPAYVSRAQVYFQSSNPDAALDDARHASRLAPDHEEIHGWCGGMLMQAGRFEDAREEFDLLLEKKPAQPAALLMRSCCWRELGVREQQLADLELLHAQHPDDVPGMNGLAWLLATCPDPDLRDGPRAVAMARRAAELTHNQDANVLDTLAAALAEDGRFDEAAETERRALAQFKKMPFPMDLSVYRDRLATYERGESLISED